MLKTLLRAIHEKRCFLMLWPPPGRQKSAQILLRMWSLANARREGAREAKVRFEHTLHAKTMILKGPGHPPGACFYVLFVVVEKTKTKKQKNSEKRKNLDFHCKVC